MRPAGTEAEQKPSAEAAARLARRSSSKLIDLLDADIADEPEDAEAAAEAAAQRAAQLEWETAERVRREGKCVECEAARAAVICEQCNDQFCDLCYESQHRKGKRRQHVARPYEIEEQAAPAAEAKGAAGDDGEGETKLSAAKLADAEADAEGEDDDDDDDEPSSAASRFISAVGRALPTSCVSRGPAAAGASAGGAGEVAGVAGTLIAGELDFVERARYIPLRLSYEQRRALHMLEAALAVSDYTDKLDSPAFQAGGKRTRMQLKEACAFLSGLVVGVSFEAGQRVLADREFAQHADFYQDMFELGRRYKVMNPEKMRGSYGKLMYLLQDLSAEASQELLGFSCVRPIETVYDELETAGGNALELLRDPNIEMATRTIVPEGKTRAAIQREIKAKEKAAKAIAAKYATHRLRPDDVRNVLYSIGDNRTFLYYAQGPIDRILGYLKEFFKPDSFEEGFSLAIFGGQDGARLSHSHERQFYYAQQTLYLWQRIINSFFQLWYLADLDLLSGEHPYALSETGQGLQRVQNSPRVARAMATILHEAQREVETWIGSSVIHLGDDNVPNALMFIDKYTQVASILGPVVRTLDSIDSFAKEDRAKNFIRAYGGARQLKKVILHDFFRVAFDGSGGEDFFQAGSCIDGRLTSAWAWCQSLSTKDFYPIFKLAGFQGFDGKF